VRFIIPPNSSFPVRDFQILAEWFVECKLVLDDINGEWPIWVDTDGTILCVTSYGVAKAPAIPGPLRQVAVRVLTSAGMATEEPMPDLMELAEQVAAVLTPPAEPSEAQPIAIPIDGLKQLVAQLDEARQAQRDAKDRADEARDQIIAYLRDNGGEVGTVDGRPAVEWKTVTKKQFETARFRVENPDMADEYTTERTENRLELL